MVTLRRDLIDTLGDLVVELRESYESEAHTVSAALAQNEAFQANRRPESELTRSVMAAAFRRGAHRLGLNVRNGQGGSVELYEPVSNGYGVIRLKRASYAGEELRVVANAGSSFGGFSAEVEDALIPEFFFVLGWILEGDEPLECFVAEVTGVEEGNPGSYIFGWTHSFAAPTPPSGPGFQPASDDDLGDWDKQSDSDIADQA